MIKVAVTMVMTNSPVLHLSEMSTDLHLAELHNDETHRSKESVRNRGRLAPDDTDVDGICSANTRNR